MTNYRYPIMESLKGIGATKFIETVLKREHQFDGCEDIVINAIDDDNGTIVATLINERGNPYRVVIYEDAARFNDPIDGHLRTIVSTLTIHDIGDTTTIEK